MYTYILCKANISLIFAKKKTTLRFTNNIHSYNIIYFMEIKSRMVSIYILYTQPTDERQRNGITLEYI